MTRVSTLRRLMCLFTATLALSAGILQGTVGALAAAGSSEVSRDQWVQVRNLIQNNKSDYAGVSVDYATQTAFVYRVASRIGRASALSVLRKVDQIAATDDGSPKAWKLHVVDVVHSLAELDGVQAEITTMQPWADDSAAYRAVWYVDPAANAVHIGVTTVTPQIATDAKMFAGMAYLAVEPRATPTSRNNDSSPAVVRR